MELCRLIRLGGRKGGAALVDERDYEMVNAFRWSQDTAGYAKRSMYKDGDYKGVCPMHRMIITPRPGEETDHINGDRLDNTRSNLRSVPRWVNQHNRAPLSSNKSGYKGVSFDKTAGKYRAQIIYCGVCISLGYFATAEDAAQAYEARRQALGLLPPHDAGATVRKSGTPKRTNSATGANGSAV